MISANSVMMRDRTTRLNQRVAGRTLDRLPLLQKRTVAAECVEGKIGRGPIRIDMGEAACDLAFQASRFEKRTLRRCLHFVVETFEPIPGGSGLKRVVDETGRCQNSRAYGMRINAFRQIPAAPSQGTRLIGSYDSQVAFGQSRALLVWTRLILPNGRSIVPERQPGADTAGNAGVEDEVDSHWREHFKAAALSPLLGAATEIGSSGNDNDIIRALRRGAGDTLNQTGQQVVSRNLSIQPTLTIRPGFPVRVIVNRDLVLEPYRV
jgi:type F conjugative transfer system protein TrbI